MPCGIGREWAAFTGRIRRDSRELTAKVSVAVKARGTLMGGNLALLAKSVGWAALWCNFDGRGVWRGGDRTVFPSAEPARGKWSAVEVLAGNLGELGVPVLGGLPIGHGENAVATPLGAMATVDTGTGTLTVEPSSATPVVPAEFTAAE